MALLELEDVSFGYLQGEPVLRGVSLQVEEGQVWALVGPNGAGKTTLLRLMAGLRRPWWGRVLLAGRDVSRLPRRQVARMVAVVPQEAHIPFPFTVRQVVAMGRTPYLGLLALGETPTDRRAVDEALTLMGLGALASRPFSHLSGGQRRRALIAMALAQEPRLLLLDEPTAHLDVGHQLEVLELLLALNARQGLTVVAALHDLNLALRFARRVALLHQGAILAQGPPEEVLQPPLLAQVYGVPLRLLHDHRQGPLLVWDFPYTPAPPLSRNPH